MIGDAKSLIHGACVCILRRVGRWRVFWLIIFKKKGRELSKQGGHGRSNKPDGDRLPK